MSVSLYHAEMLEVPILMKFGTTYVIYIGSHRDLRCGPERKGKFGT